MSFFEEAAVSLAASIRVIKHDRSAFDDFDQTVEGFFRSFGAFLFVAPLAYPQFIAADVLAGQLASDQTGALSESNLVADYLALLLSFLIWPVAVAVLVRFFALSGNYLRYMTAYNWISVPAVVIALIPDVLLLSGIASAQTIVFLSLIVFAAMMYLAWYIARTGLATTGPIAAVFAFTDLALAHIIRYSVGG